MRPRRGPAGTAVVLGAVLAALAGCQSAPDRAAGAPSASPPGVHVLPVPDPTAPPTPPAAPAALVVTVGGLVLPDRTATPGAVDPAATPEAVCADGYSKGVHAPRYRDKQAAYALYGVTETGRTAYRVDHLVPVGLGGSNDVANLWPQPTGADQGTAQKDRLELALRVLVCSGALPLPEAQAAVRTDWVAAYLAYVPPPAPPA